MRAPSIHSRTGVSNLARVGCYTRKGGSWPPPPAVCMGLRHMVSRRQTQKGAQGAIPFLSSSRTGKTLMVKVDGIPLEWGCYRPRRGMREPCEVLATSLPQSGWLLDRHAYGKIRPELCIWYTCIFTKRDLFVPMPSPPYHRGWRNLAARAGAASCT